MKVRDLIRRLEKDGWRLARTRGSHRQFKHPSKPREYVVVYERTANNWSAYSPDVPGCMATGKTRKEVERNFRDALAFHIEGLKREGLPIPEPTSEIGHVSIAA